MPTSRATAVWNGDLTSGAGRIRAKTGAFDAPYSLKSRLGEEPHTNPEELIGGAHAGCYSMMLSALLTQAGTPPQQIDTDAVVTLSSVDGGFAITKIALTVSATVPGIDAATFVAHAEKAKEVCPVSKALAGVGEVTISATLND